MWLIIIKIKLTTKKLFCNIKSVSYIIEFRMIILILRYIIIFIKN